MDDLRTVSLCLVFCLTQRGPPFQHALLHILVQTLLGARAWGVRALPACQPASGSLGPRSVEAVASLGKPDENGTSPLTDARANSVCLLALCKCGHFPLSFCGLFWPPLTPLPPCPAEAADRPGAARLPECWVFVNVFATFIRKQKNLQHLVTETERCIFPSPKFY